MELAATVAVQVCIMFLLIVLGFIIKKCKLITQEGSKQLSDILLIFVTPCVVIKAYQVDFELGLASGLLTAFIAAAVINVVSILVSKLIFGRDRTPRGQIDQYCAAYSNCGFMAIPLLEAVLGAEGVFYGSAYLAVFNILNWTHGIYLYTQDKKSLSLKKILINPGVIGVVIGLALVFRAHPPAGRAVYGGGLYVGAEHTACYAFARRVFSGCELCDGAQKRAALPRVARQARACPGDWDIAFEAAVRRRGGRRRGRDSGGMPERNGGGAVCGKV